MSVSQRAALALAPESPVPDEARDDIKDVELILTAFRTLLLLVIITAPSLLHIQVVLEPREIVLMGLAGIYNIGMGIASLLPGRYGVRRPLVVAMDTMLISVWIHFSERWELASFYFVVVVVAAMWYRVLGGVLAAAICNFLFLFMWGRVAADISLQRPPIFTSDMAINIVLLFVIGALAGYIAEAQEREREKRLERELLIANYQQEIDVSAQLQPLLISRFENNSILELGTAMQTARGAGGGDYIDALPLPDGRTLLCIADVAGKSVRAQARVPLLKYSLRALAPLNPEPAALAARLQTTLAPDLQPELYIALCLVVLDFEAHTLRYCNAGHIAPLHVRQVGPVPQITALETNSPAMGLFPEIDPVAREMSWKPGDALLFFTDGLADALSFGGVADGELQVHKLAGRLVHPDVPSAPEAAQELVDLAIAALDDKPFIARHFTMGEKFVGTGVHRDDVAVLVARFCG
jgi:serine phosphatase RsbU (regulator of sigma subunit)